MRLFDEWIALLDRHPNMKTDEAIEFLAKRHLMTKEDVARIVFKTLTE